MEVAEGSGGGGGGWRWCRVAVVEVEEGGGDGGWRWWRVVGPAQGCEGWTNRKTHQTTETEP